MKSKLAKEFVEVREQINQLKRREKLLREYFVEDLNKYNKTQKKYGDVFMALFENEREKVDLDTLHLNYPEVYEQLLGTYVYQTLKAQRRA